MATMYPNNWGFVFLKQNPFLNTPPRRPEDTVWAGFKELEGQLYRLFAEAFTSSRTQVVLGRGEYGSGKTHAAFYTRRTDYREQFREIQQVKDVNIYYVRTPKEPEHADELLYASIIEAVQFRRIRAFVKDLISVYTPRVALEKLQDLAGSETLGRALWLLGIEKERPGQLTLFQDSDESDERQKLLESFFFSHTTKSDLRRLGLSRDINSTQDRFRVLACLLQCLIGLDPVEDIGNHRRIILWIDEMEDLISYPSRYHRRFMHGLRDLFDCLTDYFTIVMNFTLSSPDYAEEIGVVAGMGFLDRFTHQIYFREPNEEEAFEYVTELLEQYRIDKPDGLPSTYPFDEEALHTLIADLHGKTPRDINQRCADVITDAFQRGVITGPGEGIISKDFVRSVGDRRLGSELV